MVRPWIEPATLISLITCTCFFLFQNLFKLSQMQLNHLSSFIPLSDSFCFSVCLYFLIDSLIFLLLSSSSSCGRSATLTYLLRLLSLSSTTSSPSLSLLLCLLRFCFMAFRFRRNTAFSSLDFRFILRSRGFKCLVSSPSSENIRRTDKLGVN